MISPLIEESFVKKIPDGFSIKRFFEYEKRLNSNQLSKSRSFRSRELMESWLESHDWKFTTYNMLVNEVTKEKATIYKLRDAASLYHEITPLPEGKQIKVTVDAYSPIGWLVRFEKADDLLKKKRPEHIFLD